MVLRLRPPPRLPTHHSSSADRQMRALHYTYLLAGIFLIAAAGFAGYVSSLALVEARASSHWPSVPGRITSTSIRFITGRHGSSGPDIHYTYSIGGRELKGSRLEVVTYSSNTSYASDALAEFKEGADVPVYYDPDHPEKAVLRPGPNWLAYLLPVLSLIMVIFGIALVRLGIRYRAMPRTG
jgi:hypothetical protein